MLHKYIHTAILATSWTHLALAKSSEIVPQDLQTAFESSDVEIQAAFGGDAVDGFDDGTTFEKNKVVKEPTFALGDASGVAPGRRYTIVMLDTTCPSSFTLHYAKANFKRTEIVRIESETAAAQAYKAPGSFGETGNERKYSFLLYENKDDDEINDLKIPKEGDVFDVKTFQDDNGFEEPGAGVGMVVKLGGQADCGGAVASSLSSQAASATERVSSVVSSVSSVVTSLASSQTMTSGSAPAVSSEAVESESSSTTTIPVSGITSSLVVVSSAVQSGPSSTLLLTSTVPKTTTSSSSTGEPAQQTTSGVSKIVLSTAVCVVSVSITVFAGFLM